MLSSDGSDDIIERENREMVDDGIEKVKVKRLIFLGLIDFSNLYEVLGGFFGNFKMEKVCSLWFFDISDF